MKKHSLETKLKAIRMVTDEKWSHGYVANEIGTAKVVIQRWLAFYEAHGIDGLISKNNNYSGEFRVRVVEYLLRNNLSYFRAAVYFNIPSDMEVGRWAKLYLSQGPSALYKKGERSTDTMKREYSRTQGKDYKEMTKKELLKEIERLDCENAYLKKLDALVQEKEKSEKKTR